MLYYGLVSTHTIQQNGNRYLQLQIVGGREYMSALEITKENFQKEVLESEKPVLIDFWATWCGPCQAVGPIVEEIAEERSEVKVCKVNVDEQPELAVKFRVMSIPTLILVKGGVEADRAVGARPKEEILAFLGLK